MTLTIITGRSLIEAVADRWDKQYPPDRHQRPDQLAIGRRLRSLDLKTATAEQVNAIIGNGSWTRLDCDLCERRVDRLARFDWGEDSDNSPTDLCVECLQKAIDAAGGAK